MRTIAVLMLLPIISYAQSHNSSCTGTKNYPAMTAYHYMTDKLHISARDIDDEKTEVMFIDRQKITALMGKTVIEQKMNIPWGLPPEAAKKMLTETFVEEPIFVLTVKVDFKNLASKKNSFIISTYINDDECSVDDAGLILLNREF